MLIRQTKDTFIRRYGNIGYIANQLTKHDRNYDENGAIFLEHISRLPQSVDDIVDKLIKVYKDVTREELRSDFIDFINDLEINKYVIIGKSIEELNAKEPFFSYRSENPKTAKYDFSSDYEKLNLITDSTDFFYDEFRKRPKVFMMQMEITSKCNERCIHCYIPTSKKNKGIDMDMDLVQKVLDEASSHGTLQLTISGGEPFMHKDIHQILRYAKERDFCISILSNLTLIEDKDIPLLKEINPSLIQVSLYSMNSWEHDSITLKTGSFNKTKGNIEKLVSADVPVQISCPVMKINWKSYKNVLKYAQELKTKAKTDFIMMAQADLNTSNLANRLSLNETEELLKEIIKVDTDYLDFIKTLIPKSIDVEKYKNAALCGVAADSICISANGDYFPCAGWQGMKLGNAYNNSLQDIWDNSEQIKFLRSITTNDFPDCIPCQSKDYCAMCLVRNYNENGGNMFKVSKHFCEVAKLNKRLVREFYNSSPYKG